MADRKIKAILFDLGETLLNFGEIDSSRVFKEACRQSYDFLKAAGQPVGRFAGYLRRNLWGLRVKFFVSRLTGKDFDSLALLKKHGGKSGFQLSDSQFCPPLLVDTRFRLVSR